MTGPVKTDGKQVAGRFAKGQSGNPNGRPAGSRNRATLALDALIDGSGEAVVKAMVDAALKGDVSAGRALLDRLVPPRKDRLVSFELPVITTAAEASAALGAIVTAVAAGDITPDEAGAVSKLVVDFIRALEASEIERRLAALEERNSRS